MAPSVQKPSPCNCLNLRRAATALSSLYDACLAPYALSIAQFSLLQHIQALEPVNVSSLADAMELDRTTLVRNLKPLEEQGLVQDLAAGRGRDRRLTLSALGRSRYREGLTGWRKAQDKVEAVIPPEDLARFTGWLQVIKHLGG